ncbi:hypothetical protein ABZ897_36030 [Nonomuraea sp. NPDC046802]|uniref:hypothetical protein n=1 Tax=Nonomuraea sp. NPDC046802 TaxID=3154919 RepID=UPI0033C9C87A
MLDVKASDFAEAASVARGRLEQRGWSEVFSSDEFVQMESSRWKGTTIVLDRVKRMDSMGAVLEPEAERALQADPAKWDSYIVVSLSSVGE